MKLNQISRKSTIALTCLALLATTPRAWANAFTCSGPVTGVSIDLHTGDILSQQAAGLHWPRLCSIRSSAGNGIGVEECKRMHSTLMAAQLTNKSVTVWINPTAGITNCANLSAWNWVYGLYFLRLDP